MENVGLLQWLFVLLVIGFQLLGIATARRQVALQHLGYAACIWPLRGARIVVVLLVTGYALRGPEVAAVIGLGLLLFTLAAVFLSMRWSVHRTSEICRSRWFALLLIIPLVNRLILIGLCFLPDRRRGAWLPG